MICIGLSPLSCDRWIFPFNRLHLDDASQGRFVGGAAGSLT
jgi:hypothetical protein